MTDISIKQVRLLAVVILVVLFAGTAAAQGVRAYDGFEDGDYTNNPAWSVTTGQSSDAGVQQSFVKNGQYSLHLNSTGGAVALSHDRGTDDSVSDGDKYQFWIQATSQEFAGLHLSNSDEFEGEDGIAGRLTSNGDFEIASWDGTGSFNEQSRFGSYSTDAWYRFVITVNPSQSNATLEVFDESGTSLGTASVSTTGASNLQYVVLSARQVNSGASVYYDDASYSDDAPNQPPSVENVTTTPADPNSGDDVNVSADISDPDGDTISWAGASVWEDGTKTQTNVTQSSISGNTYSWTDLITNAQAGSTYTVQIEASDGAATSATNTSFTANEVTPPNISYNPSSTGSGSFSQSYIFVNVSATDNVAVDTVTEEFDGVNSSFTTNMGSDYWENHTGLADGTYTVQAFANDTSGNTNSTAQRSITLDTTSPTITIHNPNNQTYTTSDVALDVTADESIDTWQYSLDDGANQTFTPNTTLTGLNEGGHTIDVYANDSAGNTEKASVSFTVNAKLKWKNIGDNISDNIATHKETIGIFAEWLDDGGGLNQSKLSLNDTGTFVNQTSISEFVNYTDPAGWSSVSLQSNTGFGFSSKSAQGDWSSVLEMKAAEDTLADVLRSISGNPTPNEIRWWIRDTEVSDSLASAWLIRDSSGNGITDATIGSGTLDIGPDTNVLSVDSNTWYEIRIYNINFSSSTLDYEILNTTGSVLSSGSHDFKSSSASNFGEFRFQNLHDNLNSKESVYLDDIRYESTTVQDFESSNRWAFSNFTYSNSTLVGNLSYKIYGQDKDGKWNVTDTGSLVFNADPVQKNSTLTWDGIGGTLTKEIKFGYIDADTNDIKNVSSPPSGSLSSTNTTATVSSWNSPFDWSAFVTDFQGVQSGRRDINVTTTDTGYREDDFSHTLSNQQWNRTVSVENRGDLLKSVTVGLADNGSVVSAGSLSGQLKTGNNNSTTEVWSGDNITETEHSFDPQGKVQLDTNYIGDRNLELLNQRAFQWTGIDTTSITTPNKCSQTNNTAVNLAASATTNYTVEFSCDPGTTHNTGLTTQLDLGSNNVTKRNYSGTAEIFDNETRTVDVEWKIDKNELTDWDNRNNATAYLDGNTTGVTITDQPNNVIVTFNTSCCTSSPAQGNHSTSLVYFIGEDDTTDPGGGGGGGGGGGTTPDEDTTVRFANTDFTVAPGTNMTDTFAVQNYADEQNTVQITKSNDDECQYVSVQRTLNSDQFGPEGTYQVPSQLATGEFQSFSQVNPQVRISMPENVSATLDDGQITCGFTVSATTGVAEPLNITASPGIPLLQQVRQAVEQGLDGLLAWYRENIGPLVDGTICVRPLDAITGEAECEQSVPRPAPTSLPFIATLLITAYTGNRVRQGESVIPGG